MNLRIALISSMLISSAAHSALDNNIIASQEASHITLAGRIGEAAMYSVQADDDDRAEIFATASSQIDKPNDHWLLLDWNGSDYKIIKTGALQSTQRHYLSSYQLSFQEIILGHQNGLVSKILFSYNDDTNTHQVNEEQFLLSSLKHNLEDDTKINSNIQSIVSLQANNLNEYIVVCTDDYMHVLDNNELKSPLNTGGYCQTGNIDYEKLVIDSNIYDEELITASGLYFNFDGTSWIRKTGLSSNIFGDNFKVANIDDDDADEILSQAPGQLQSFSPANTGSWVYISSIQKATSKFNLLDLNNDGTSEVIFDYIYTDEPPHKSWFNIVSWDTTNDTHKLTGLKTSPHIQLSQAQLLATNLTGSVASNMSLFISNNDIAKPDAHLLAQLNPNTLNTQWSGLVATATRSFDGIVKAQTNNNISDYKIAQIEQMALGENTYIYALKYLEASAFNFESIIKPDFSDDEIISINALSTFDFNGDGIDELHFGGAAGYTSSSGLVLSSNQDGSDHSRLDTPSIEAITALFVGNINNQNSTDIIASGKEAEGKGIGVHSNLDGNNQPSFWFAPSNGDTDFKQLIAANIKGTDNLEVLGLHSQLASIDLNAGFLDSKIYNLSNLDLDQFTPITLVDRPYEYALASDASGMLHFIEPKDFDILASVKACDTTLSAIRSVEINNNTHVAFAICNQSLLSWILEYDSTQIDFGYSLHPLTTTDLGHANTENGEIAFITTDNLKTHLFVLLKNQFLRLTLNNELSDDSDNDGKLNYRDTFPNDITQWEDKDQDELGDNQSGNNPDPSLNDIDNDGVPDATDIDNRPFNDFDPSNDTDNGAPKFTNIFNDINISSNHLLTKISIDTPTATDLFDDYYSNGPLDIVAAINNQALTKVGEKFETELSPGRHSVSWQVSDKAGNKDFDTQTINLYPSVAFTQNASKVGETLTSNISLELSGESPVYPVDITLNVRTNTANNDDIIEDISNDLHIRFEDGETSKSITLTAKDDDISEVDETLFLTIKDNFSANTWTVNSNRNTHTLTIIDVNEAPNIDIIIQQGGKETVAPNPVNGAITLATVITDDNISDTHTYLWNLKSLGLGESLAKDLQFNPSNITPGIYTVTLTVTDNGLPAHSTMKTLIINIVYGDSDGDGVTDDVDKFPNDIREWLDTDGDGYGDRFADEFPKDASEHADADKDGTGDNADPFDNDPSETKDTDNDGVGDNKDAFPEDAKEQIDTDGDGVGDNADMYPTNKEEQYDTDRDGIGNNADQFPLDPKETKDSDGDGVGDNADQFPNDAKRSKEDTTEEKKEDEENGFGSGGSLPVIWLLILLPILFSRQKRRLSNI